jgi:hypothetical protein
MFTLFTPRFPAHNKAAGVIKRLHAIAGVVLGVIFSTPPWNLEVATMLRHHANRENPTALALKLSFRPGIIARYASSGIRLLRSPLRCTGT